MRLSAKARYAVRAMYDLASQGDAGPVSLRRVAERQGISRKYLEQIFIKLKERGLIKGVRGARGGYLLARGPEKVSLRDIMAAVDEPLAPVHCLKGNPKTACERAEVCVARSYWKRLGERIESFLENCTLSDLLNEDAGNRDKNVKNETQIHAD